MWKPLVLLGSMTLLFFSFVLFGGVGPIFGSAAVVISLLGFWIAARAINKEAR